MAQASLDLFSLKDRDIDQIHRATAIYTAPPEIEALLDSLNWPACGGRLLDPGAGNGGFVVAALARLALKHNDPSAAADRVRGYEFHAGAVQVARAHVSQALQARGWDATPADQAALRIIEHRDFLLSPVPVGHFSVIAKNAPYLRLANLPAAYRIDFEENTAAHARGDLLHAFLQKSADVLADGGVIGMISSDRWLLNEGPSELRRRLGERFTVRDVRRLDSSSAFYRPKSRVKGTPPRVHPVALVLDPGGSGLPLGAAPFPIDGCRLNVQGTPLGELAAIQLAPYVGPKGIFVLEDPGRLPMSHLTPCVEPDDIHPTEDRITGSRRWVITTERGVEPPFPIKEHLARTLGAMSERGRKNASAWLPPEPFAGKFPLTVDAVLVPRIARRLRAVCLPAGVMPINHNLVVVSGVGVERIQQWLNHPSVQAQASAAALRLENGFASFTAALLRQLRIPLELIDPQDLATSRRSPRTCRALGVVAHCVTARARQRRGSQARNKPLRGNGEALR